MKHFVRLISQSVPRNVEMYRGIVNSACDKNKYVELIVWENWTRIEQFIPSKVNFQFLFSVNFCYHYVICVL